MSSLMDPSFTFMAKIYEILIVFTCSCVLFENYEISSTGNISDKVGRDESV